MAVSPTSIIRGANPARSQASNTVRCIAERAPEGWVTNTSPARVARSTAGDAASGCDVGSTANNVSRAYGVLLEDAFFANRAYFLIDPDGIIRWAHVEEHPGLKHSDAEILGQIDRLSQD